MKTTRFISLLLCMVMIMSLFTGLAGSASADDVILHEVKDGEIMIKICEKHGLDYYKCKDAIVALNGFQSEAQLAKLTVGQTLKLPASDAIAKTVSTSTTTTTAVTTSTTVNGVTTTTTTTSSVPGNSAAGTNVAFYLVPYTVKSGDTLQKICSELGSNYYYYSPVIQSINGLANPNSIQPGQVLLIPSPSSNGATKSVISHKVKAGETITSICDGYLVNYQAQKYLVNGVNRRDNMDRIYVGQTVLIPTDKTVTATATATTATAAAAPAAASTTAANSGTYQISISAATNGSPFAIVNNVQYATRANAGETVQIEPSPKAGYAVRDIQVIRTDSGADVPVSNYSFTMPNSSVQITVFFSRGQVINKVASPYGTFDTMIYGTNANSAFYGDEITLAIYPKNGYNVVFPDKKAKTTGVYYQKSDLSLERIYVWPDDDGFYTFKMPNYEIRLTVDFEISTYVALRADTHKGSGSVNFYVDGEKVTRAREGDIVTMEFVPSYGWTFKSDSYEQSANGLARLRDRVKDNEVTKVSDTIYRFKVGKLWTTIYSGKFAFENRNYFGLWSQVSGGHGSISFQIVDGNKAGFPVLSRDVGYAQGGDFVEVILRPDNGYAFNEAKDFSYMKANSKQNSSGAQLRNGSWASTSGRYIFQMPSDAVTVAAKFRSSKGTVYHDLNLWFDSNQGAVTALQDGKPVTRAEAGKEITIQITAKDNYRVSSVQWLYEGSGEKKTIKATKDPLDPKVYTATFKKHSGWDTIRVNFESHSEYTKVGKPVYSLNTPTSDPAKFITNNKVKLKDLPSKDFVNVKVGSTFTFKASAPAGFTVSEVWLIRSDKLIKMMAPVSTGSNEFSYTVTSDDRGKEIRFLAVQLGEEPRHNIIPEYIIANTGITNVGAEELYYISVNGGAETAVGPVYGMGAKLTVTDKAIKSDQGVKVRVRIPKTIHAYEGVSTTLYYQVDTVTIRFSDYVLNNYKILDDNTNDFVYDFWYDTKTPLSDLNIMVNFKEVGTNPNTIAADDTIVTIDGKKVVVVEDPPGSGIYKGKIVTGDSTSTVEVTVTP